MAPPHSGESARLAPVLAEVPLARHRFGRVWVSGGVWVGGPWWWRWWSLTPGNSAPHPHRALTWRSTADGVHPHPHSALQQPPRWTHNLPGLHQLSCQAAAASLTIPFGPSGSKTGGIFLRQASSRLPPFVTSALCLLFSAAFERIQRRNFEAECLLHWGQGLLMRKNPVCPPCVWASTFKYPYNNFSQVNFQQVPTNTDDF